MSARNEFDEAYALLEGWHRADLFGNRENLRQVTAAALGSTRSLETAVDLLREWLGAIDANLLRISNQGEGRLACIRVLEATRRLLAEHVVREAHPAAYAHLVAKGDHQVLVPDSDDEEPLGRGSTEAAAWLDAARRLGKNGG